MANAPSDQPRTVKVREQPIELCQLLKFAGLADSGGAAKQAVADGAVLVNGEPESRKRRKLLAGDRVSVAGQTVIVQVGGD